MPPKDQLPHGTPLAAASEPESNRRRTGSSRVATGEPSDGSGRDDASEAVAAEPVTGSQEPVRAFLGLGSNLGDRAGQLRQAVARLDEVVAVSDVYETEPVGGPPQGRYLNVVVELRTARSPRKLLAECHRLEALAGRRRTVRFGPRTLDVDVLLVGDAQVAEEDLVVPHPRLWERRFVLVPLAELAPELVPPDAWDKAGGEVRHIGTLSDVDVIA
jgi:2-amino-4-hydroxy-6-hydroxymethyldihydropteridine diphosphokinase